MSKNIQEYVINKIIEHIDESKKEIEKRDKKIKNMKRILKDNDICFECICSKCNKKIYDLDTHSHNAHEDYPTLCYRCFFSVL